MGIVPEHWLDGSRMKRIVCHWSAGGHKASALDRQHYHILVEDDGELVRGLHSIAANESTRDKHYAAHTLGLNAGSIGIAVCCMANAEESPFNPGRAPMTRKQWETMAQVAAELCKAYSIPVSPTTVLGHGEVERNLGIRQRQKWDPLVLPWDTGLAKREVGDVFRALVNALLEGPSEFAEPSRVKTTLAGVEVEDAVSFNEDSFVRMSDLLQALQLDLLEAEAETALVAKPGKEGGITYLSYTTLGGTAPDAAGASEKAFVLKDGYVSIRHLAEVLKLEVDFDMAAGRLEVGAAAAAQATSVAAEPKAPRSVTIKSGDTLSALAERYLGSAAKWKLLRREDGKFFSEAQAKRLKLGEVILLPDAAPVEESEPPAATVRAAGDGFDPEALAAAAGPGLAALARASVPVILAECQAAGVTKPAHVAYVLATSEHESKCGRFMRELWGPTAAQRGYEGRENLGNTERGDGFRFRGRGFAQVTGRANYKTWADELRTDIVTNPDTVASDPKIAARIMVLGMRDGRFRGSHKLDDFLSGEEPDFFNARDIINGDKKLFDSGQSGNRGTRIAEIAARYLAAMTPA